ncbi:guanine nucleotide binding protein, alpha subunit [Globomyces pollinis-pini]|nr:guanine nucleotide binding protein, alpha subunit [Globomyces pollinis-pini]
MAEYNFRRKPVDSLILPENVPKTKSLATAIQRDGGKIVAEEPDEDQKNVNPKLEAKKIEAYLKAEKKKFEQLKNEPKLLLLGPSDSGKSTFLKQLKLLHGKGFTPEELQVAKHTALGNILSITEQLILNSSSEIQSQFDILLKFISLEIGPFESYPLHIIQTLLKFWEHEQIQQKFEEMKGIFPLTTKHFFDNMERIAAPSSVLTNNDVLLLRSVTQAISDNIVVINDINFHFYDVSGLKHHRKHWIPYFDDVNCVVFVINVAAFDQKMVEDPDKNQMHDALTLFERICNNPLLAKSQLMLFFNKKDLFLEKIRRLSLVEYFPDYTGKVNSNSEGLEFFKTKFRALNQINRPYIPVHLTCCTDTEAMKVIVAGVVQNLIEKNLTRVGYAEE